MDLRPRRSLLYVPGANAKAQEKAKGLAADGLILDLEDSVAPEAKRDARAAIVTTMAAGGYGDKEVLVRVNALSTEWGADDVAAAAAERPHGVLFPKINSADDVETAQRTLDKAGATDTALWIMVETPLSILNIASIAATKTRTRLTGFVMGLNDLAKDMRAASPKDRWPFVTALTLAATAARAYDIALIDGVHNDIEDGEGFAWTCKQTRDLGFDGRSLIHPSQIAPANAIYGPSTDETAWARDVIAAFDLPENVGKGVIKVNGKMTELLHRAQALRIVAVAAAIEKAGAAS